jgi:tRNA wybutosine-synthesizing protein 1
MDAHKREVLERQGYRVVGDHSGVKVCHWTKQSLVNRRDCYKGTFYGIQSHRCLQMTPSVNQCNLNCFFCWREQDWGTFDGFDDPAFILEESVEAQRELLTGFKGNPKVAYERWLEANHPRHVAISLTGEPTLYKHLPEFIRLCHERGMTTFLVTNGTTPGVLERLDPLPTQLYVTIQAPTPSIYEALTAPMVKNGWSLLNRTLDLLPRLDTRKVIRLTLVKGWNLGWEDEYAAMIARADPHFVETKGYVHVGPSRDRLTRDSMPTHGDIREFAQRLADRIGYALVAERRDSTVCLLLRPGAKRFLDLA